MWRNLKNVSNPYMYLLTPENSMFLNRSMGQPFDMTYNGAGYQKWKKEEQYNFNRPNDNWTKDEFVSGGYSTSTFTTRQHWKMEAEDDSSDPNYYHYTWTRYANYMKNETSDSYLQRNVPIPSALFGDNVLIERNLMTVWKMEFNHKYQWSDGQETSDPYVEYYYGNKPYTKGSTLNYTNIENINYGLCQQWRMPFVYFPWFHNEVMDLRGFPKPYDPASGWG